ncbi:3-oxoadipate enol-lactonase [Telmatospirillum siberiense]|uniref:3-oxoadipate enol-lactonase n=1 Tax=Telmatospirillum siberiense TaxID=382514 RepID=A0A2N3PV21_9PROT|nr:3-oxoadipate enol-lactonase [Telmatospirillum siberiense]PKU24245.1 3-oxoadipate enol-lactonase [Telmatospirillum siberiense]
MPMIDVAGLAVHYRLDGPEDAPVLVLSNSLGTTLDMWRPQLAAFSRRFRLLRYDSRGHGETTVPPGPYAIGQMAGDLLGLLDALGFDRVHFCGLSMGGMVGQSLALRAPERLDRLLLCNTAAVIGPPEAWDRRAAAVEAGGMAAVAPVVERWFTADFLRRFPDDVAPFAAMLRDTPPKGYVGCCHAIREHDLRFLVSAISTRTMVIAGTHDVATPPGDGRFLAGAIPGAIYVELPAAHLSNVEAAGPFTRAVLAFLNG